MWRKWCVVICVFLEVMMYRGNAEKTREFFGLGCYDDGERQWSYRAYDGTVEATFDDAGNNLGANRYGAFGARISNVGEANDREAFQGQDFREDVNHYNLGVRNMAPDEGRWLQPEPLVYLGQPPLGSSYRYAANNPVVFTDPSGYGCEQVDEEGDTDYWGCLKTAVGSASKYIYDTMTDPDYAMWLAIFNEVDMAINYGGPSAMSYDGGVDEEIVVVALRSAGPRLKIRSGVKAGALKGQGALLTDAEWRQLSQEMIARNLTVAQLGREYGISQFTIHGAFKRIGLPTRGPKTGWALNEKYAPYYDKIERMYAEGRSLQEIGNSLGMRGSTVDRILERMGIVRRPSNMTRDDFDADVRYRLDDLDRMGPWSQRQASDK